jgi:hypothetical protein
MVLRAGGELPHLLLGALRKQQRLQQQFNDFLVSRWLETPRFSVLLRGKTGADTNLRNEDMVGRIWWSVKWMRSQHLRNPFVREGLEV